MSKLFNIEKILLISMFLCLFVLITTQAAFSLHFFKVYESKEYINGEPLKKDVYLYKEIKCYLNLVEGKCTENLKVLINGEEVTSFTKKDISLTLKEGDVVEIDARLIDEKSAVLFYNDKTSYKITLKPFINMVAKI